MTSGFENKNILEPEDYYVVGVSDDGHPVISNKKEMQLTYKELKEKILIKRGFN